MITVNSRSEVRASNTGRAAKVCSTYRNATLAWSRSDAPSGVRTYRPPSRARSSSPKWRRRRASAALVAGWLNPIDSPARVTLRSRSSARRATSRFRSIPGRSIAPTSSSCPRVSILSAVGDVERLVALPHGEQRHHRHHRGEDAQHAQRRLQTADTGSDRGEGDRREELADEQRARPQPGAAAALLEAQPVDRPGEQ